VFRVAAMKGSKFRSEFLSLNVPPRLCPALARFDGP
jgi:hypothetical protein